MLRTAVTEHATPAGLAVLTTISIGRDVAGCLVAGTELGLAASLAMSFFTAVALSRTTIAISASLTGLAVFAAEAVGRNIAGLAVASTELGLAAGVTVILLVTAPATSRTAVSKCTALASLAIEGSTTTVGRDSARVSFAGTKSSLAACATVAFLSAVALLGATIAVSASLASFSILATEAVGRDVSLSIARTKLGLASSVTVTLLATVAFLGTTVTERATLASLAVLSTEAISGDIASVGQGTVAEPLLTSRTAMLGLVSTPAARRAAVSKARVKTNLAISATLAVKGDVAGRTTSAKVWGTVVTAMRSRVTAPALRRTTVAKSTTTTNEFVGAATRTIRRDTPRA